MNPEREQPLREISTLFGVRFGRLVELVESQHVPQDDSRDAQIVYAFNKSERVIQLERALREARQYIAPFSVIYMIDAALEGK